MDVTPKEINEKQFRDAWRGYNQEEVDDFLDRIAETLESAQRESRSLRDRNYELEQALATTREAEEMLKKTLVTAQRAAEEAIAKAKTKADQLVTEAEERAKGANDEASRIIDEAEAEAKRKTLEGAREGEARRRALDGRLERLGKLESDLEGKLRAFLEQQQRALDAFTSERAERSSDQRDTGASARESAAVGGMTGSDNGPAADNTQRIVRVDRSSQEQEERQGEDESAPAHKRGVKSLFFREEE
jgi:cell division initiation protein